MLSAMHLPLAENQPFACPKEPMELNAQQEVQGIHPSTDYPEDLSSLVSHEAPLGLVHRPCCDPKSISALLSGQKKSPVTLTLQIFVTSGFLVSAGYSYAPQAEVSDQAPEPSGMNSQASPLVSSANP